MTRRTSEDDKYGTTKEYRRAFEEIQKESIHDNHLALLREHFASPDHTATWEPLARKVGYANFNAVSLQYGIFAGRVANHLGLIKKPEGFWLFVLAKWADHRDPKSGHTRFVLRRPVIRALLKLGIVKEKEFFTPNPDEVVKGSLVRDGGRRAVLVNVYERNPVARKQCIAAHGVNCCICGFNFGEVYGQDAEGFIHIHHIEPHSKVGGEHDVDPVKDLRPVCPNCHAVLHLGGECRSIEEVQKILRRKHMPSQRRR